MLLSGYRNLGQGCLAHLNQTMRCRGGSERPTLADALLLPSVRAHNAKHGMIQRFLLKVGERGLRGHAKVGLDKRDALRFSDKLFENWCCFSRPKLDNSDGFGATSSRELRLASGPQVAHPVHFSKGSDQKAGAAVFHQYDRDRGDLSARAPSYGEQDRGATGNPRPKRLVMMVETTRRPSVM
jgi:hypothetical protein